MKTVLKKAKNLNRKKCRSVLRGNAFEIYSYLKRCSNRKGVVLMSRRHFTQKLFHIYSQSEKERESYGERGL